MSYEYEERSRPPAEMIARAGNRPDRADSAIEHLLRRAEAHHENLLAVHERLDRLNERLHGGAVPDQETDKVGRAHPDGQLYQLGNTLDRCTETADRITRQIGRLEML